MKKAVLVILLCALILSPLTALASDITDADYVATIQATNTGALATNVSANVTLGIAALIAAGQLNAGATNIIARDDTGADTLIMPGYGGNPTIVLFDSILSGLSRNAYIFTGNVTGYTPVYFPGATGMTVPDGMTEPGGNFSIQENNTYIDTTAGVNKIIIYKPEAIISAVDPATTGTINTALYSPNALDFEATNTDYVTVVDSNNFSFTDGAGTDTSFSISGWCKPETLGIEYFASKARTAVTYEWFFGHHSSGNVTLGIINTDSTAYIIKYGSCSITPGTWYHVACTYDGSETGTGIKLYLNGVLISTTTTATGGVYTGMTNTASAVEFGRILGAGAASAYYDGTLSNFKIWKGTELSAAEVLGDYNAPYAAYPTNLVGWYKFIDGAGSPTNYIDAVTNATANTADWVTTGGKGWLSTFSKTGVTSGEYDYQLSLSGGTLGLYLDGVLQASVASGAIPNSTANWQFGSQDATLYIGDIAYSVGGVSIDTWTWRYGATFPGTVTGNIGTPSFRTTSSDADVSAELISFEPLTESVPEASVISDWPEMITAAPDQPDTMYSENTTPGIPILGPLIAAVWPASIPSSLFWYNFAFFFILAAGIITFRIVAAKGHNGLFLKCLTMAVVMIFFALPGPNIYGMYVVIYFIFWCFGALVLSRNYGW